MSQRKELNVMVNMWTKKDEIALINQLQDKYIERLSMMMVSTRAEDVAMKFLNFTAPTGTGKTKMMAKLINKFSSAFFIVTTLSKGQLNQQIADSFHCDCLYDNYIVYGTASYKSNTVLTEKDILQSLPCDRDVYWLRDEGHINTNKWAEALEDKCKKIINFSATNKMTYGVECDFTETMMLRAVHQQIGRVNHALDKLKSIKDEHRHVLNYNPCALFRITTRNTENFILDQCKKYGFKAISLVNFDNYKMNDLCEDNNQYDVIISKQKIVEGVDIRRAHVVYMESKPKNASTTIQQIGRCRRNALLWRDDIDILDSKNKTLLNQTRQCFVFYDIKSDECLDDELYFDLCPIISIQKLHSGYTIYVESGVMPNGLQIAELTDKTGFYTISTDVDTGFNVVNNPEIYQTQLINNSYCHMQLESYRYEHGLAQPPKESDIQHYQSVYSNKLLTILGIDNFKQHKLNNSVVWIPDNTITAKVSNNTKFNQYIKNIYAKHISQASYHTFTGQNDFEFDKSMNSCLGYCVEYYTKYLLYGEEFLGDFIVRAMMGCHHLDNRGFEQEDILLTIRACLLKYKDMIRKNFGEEDYKNTKVPTVIKLRQKQSQNFVKTILALSQKAAQFIKANLNTSESKQLNCCFNTKHIIGVADFMDKNTIIDLKCTNHIDLQMVKQVLGYHFLSQFRNDLEINKVIVYDAVSDRHIKIQL